MEDSSNINFRNSFEVITKVYQLKQSNQITINVYKKCIYIGPMK